MHVTAEQARHFAYVISECQKRDIKSIEPTQEAEEAWCDTIVKGTALRGDFFKECTPGYYNNEGKPSISAARNATYGFGSPAFIKILTEWRNANDLAGLDVKYNTKDNEEQPATNGTDTGEQPVTNGTGVGEHPITNGTNLAETPVQTETERQVETQEETQAAPQVEAQAPRKDGRTLIQQYSDLQAKHQAEMNDLLNKHRGEVERLLAKQNKVHAKKDSGVEGV
jgi:cyclohexanone monooxygenase